MSDIDEVLRECGAIDLGGGSWKFPCSVKKMIERVHDHGRKQTQTRGMAAAYSSGYYDGKNGLDWNPDVPHAKPAEMLFPVALRKMWSGGDVMEWLNDNGPFYTFRWREKDELWIEGTVF